MAFYQDNVSFTPSSPKLPDIGNRSILSSSSSSSSSVHWPIASQWSITLRTKLEYSINYNGHPHTEDVNELCTEFVKVIIAALQPTSSKQDWLELNHIIGLIAPFSKYFHANSISHYVERLVLIYTENMEKLYDIPILDSLSNAFPVETNRIQAKYGAGFSGANAAMKYFKKSLVSQIELPPSNLQNSPGEELLVLPDGKSPYLLKRKGPGDNPLKQFRTKPLSLSTLSKNIAPVAEDTVNKESLWKEKHSTTVAAINCRFPDTCDDANSDVTSEWSETTEVGNTARHKKTVINTKLAEFHSMTGREAVELFIQHKHLHKVKFLYLNKAPNRHYRPYDLVSVPRDHIDNEHFIFSSFGVLHVFPEENYTETLTLAGWHKDAVNWNMITKLKFFKNFLIGKLFKSWKLSVRRIKFLRTRKVIQNQLLLAVPDFGSALLHIFRLLHELSEVVFLPGKPPTVCQYTVLEYESDANRIRVDVQNVLELFFKYSKKVVDTTKRACFDQLKYYEHQAKYSRPLFMKESLYLQRRKQEIRLENLNRACDRTKKIPAFITLIDQAISVHLVALARNSVTKFVNDVLFLDSAEDVLSEETFSTAGESLSTAGKGMTESKDDSMLIISAVFAAKFVFNKQNHQLEMQPSVEKFRTVMLSSIAKILSLMCDRAHSMHSVRVFVDAKRPGSAPTSSVGSSRTEMSSEVLTDSSLSSFASDSDNLPPDVDLNPNRENKNTLNQEHITTSIINSPNEAGLTDPQISLETLPNKADDDDGIVTPDMMLKSGEQARLGLTVDGKGMMDNYGVLDKIGLRDRMLRDMEIANSVKVQEEMVASALKEVVEFSDEHNVWLAEIRRFTSTWDEEEMGRWKGKPARSIEDLLNRIKAWIEKVKNMERSLVTENKLLYVDCRLPNTCLLPALNTIFKKLIAMTVAHAKTLSVELTNEAKDALRILKNKDTNMKSFATYARKVTESVKHKEDLTQKVNYIRSLYEVVRMTYRQLSQEEEKLDEKVKSTWDAFLFQLKDATNFVSNQRPVITKQLDEIFQAHYQKALSIYKQSASGFYIEPDAHSNEVIEQLSVLLRDYQETLEKLSELSVYRESVCGKKYELGELFELQQVMAARYDLWKYVNVSEYTIADWKLLLFRKFNANLALEKIHEWQHAIVTLTEHLPQSDPVLQHWSQVLENLARELPLLNRLSNEAIRTRHWRALFTGMGELMEPDATLTLNDLLSYKPSQFSDVIIQVYNSAIEEYSLDQILRIIKRQWEERQFHLAKHIYVVSVDNEADDLDEDVSSNAWNNKDWKTNLKDQRPSTQEKDSDTFVLVGVDDLLRDLSECHVTLQGMFQSRHAVEIKADAEIWSDTLQQLGEIVNLWVSCQDKWMYLNRVFCSDTDLAARFSKYSKDFEFIDEKYREFISAMSSDPKVLSVLSRRHGQKGWRELQGENLRKHLVLIINSEERVLHGISSLLEDYRSQFPRLFFFSDDDCVRLIGISRQPKALLPYVKKCFSGVTSLVFTLPGALGDQSNKSLDLELHSNKLEVTNVIGNHGDMIKIERLPAQNIATTWLSSLESRIKTSVYKQLQLAIEERIKEGTLKIANVMEEIWELDSLYDATNPTAHTLSHWLLKYPSQVTLLSNSILWFRDVHDWLKRGGKKEDHEKIKQDTIYRLKQFGQVLLDNTPYVEKSSIRKRLQIVLAALILQTAHQRDILKTLEGENITSDLSYAWQSLLRHTVDIDDYSRMDLLKPTITILSQSSPLLKTAIVGNCYVEQLGHRDMYGYEFHGISSGSTDAKSVVNLGTVITPTTERCSLGLNLAIHLGQCATLFGENSTGKSLIISELARAYGRHLTTITCSDHLSNKVFKQLLCGMLETGSWLCFDHAHKLPLTSLSKLSQYIKQIQDSYAYLKTYQHTQYSVRGSDNCNRLKRSNSISTLHQVYPSADKLKSHIGISESFVDSNNRESYEDYDIHTSAFKLPKDLGIEQFTPGSLVFSGRLLKVRSGFATLMTFSTEEGKYPEVPESMKLVYRPTCLIKPDQLKIIEVWLQAAGFNDVVNLSKKLDLMHKIVNGNSDHISSANLSNIMHSSPAQMCTVGLPTLKCIIGVAMQINCKLKTTQRSRSQSQSSGMNSPTSSPSLSSVGRSSRRSEVALSNVNEEIAIVNAVFHVITPKLAGDSALMRLKDCLRNIFPQSNQTSVGEQDPVLAGEIEQQMVAEKLHPSRDWITKVCQLHTVLQLNKTVVITGTAGAGKTTLYKMLAKALNYLCNEASSKFLKQPKAHGLMSEKKLSTENMDRSSACSVNSAQNFGTHLDLPNPGSNFFDHGRDYNRIDMTVVFPNAHDADELFGHYENANFVWKQGLLVKMLKECTIVHKMTKKVEKKSESVLDATLQPSTAPHNKDAIPISKRLPSLQKWIIMDGDADSTWVDRISCLLDDHQSSVLSNLDNLNFPLSTNVIFETADFSAISPAVTASCAILHCDIPNHWQQISHSWFDSAYAEFALTQNCLKVMSDMLHDLVPPTLKFLSKKNSSILKSGLTSYQEEKVSSSGGIRKITSFFDILSSSLKYHSMTRESIQHSKNNEEKVRTARSNYTASNADDAHSTTTHGSVRSRLDDSVPDGHHLTALNLFGFSFVWAFGGDLAEDDMLNFDQFVRVQFKKSRQGINFPDYETVFEYFVDEEFGRFTLWEDKIDLHSKLVAQEGVSIPYTPVHQLEKYSYISSMLLKSQKSVLLMGPTGCGKTSLVSNLIHAQQNLSKIVISPGLSASHFQRLIESKASLFMKQHNLGLMAHPNAIIASRVTERHPSRFFLDDLSIAGVNKQTENSTKIQPCLELLRQIICLNGVYEHDRLLFKSLQAEIAFIATATTPGSPGSGLGYSRFTLSPRLTKNFTVIHFLKPTREAILSIYHDSVQSWLEEFPAYSLVRHYDLSQAIISGSYDLYDAVSSFIKPTPRHAHCIFSIHDINKIMQGLFLLAPRTRGRPKPARQQPRRPGGGRHVGRFRGNRGWGDLATGGVPPMMRTVVRLWLHECTRVFCDRLVDGTDRRWFSKSLHDVLKKQFCSSKDTKLSSPTIEKVRIIKTPVPSGVTPIPGSTSTSLFSTPSLENTNNVEIRNAGASDTEGTESSFDSHANIELLEIQKQEGMSTSGESMTLSLHQTSDTSPFRSQINTGASSVTMKDYIYDSSPSQQNNDTDNDVTTSEATTQIDDDAATTRATTAVQDDETQSGVTGYTTEMESVFGSRSESASESRSSKSTSEKSLHERSRKPTVEFASAEKTVIYPSSGFTVSEDETMKLDDSSSHQQLKSRPSGAKLGVTFMPGLIDDIDVSANATGPLIPIEQVLSLGEDATSVLFSRGILEVALRKANTSEGIDTYAESTEAQLSKALQICLEGFNEKQKSEVECMDLVFFGQAVRHAARLSRILTIKKNGHALLLSSSRLTGRHSLIKLISYLVGATTYSVEPNTANDNIRDSLRKLIRRASHTAGIKNKLAVLTVDGPTALSPECLNDICALIRDGQCPALYTQRELASIAADMASANVKASNSDTNISGSKMTALEKLDHYLEQYFSRIVSNLHVIVLASYPQFEGFYDVSSTNKDECGNLFFHHKKELMQFYHFLRRCPDLLTRFSCVDLHEAWDHSSCQKLAHHFLKKSSERTYEAEEDAATGQERRPVSMPWNDSMPAGQQLYNVSQMMAFIHLDALARIKGCIGHNADIIVTVHTLKQMIQLFVGISKMIKVKEARHIKHYEKALLKVQDAEESLHGYHRNLQLLLPRLSSARATERSWKKHVENEREEYAEAKQRCSIEEENILLLERDLEELREQSKVAFDQANPMYQKAFEAIQCLDEHTLDEIKRYKKPPSSVVLVVTCLCHMFNVQPADWDNGKVLIMQEKFFQNLEFYDKDNIPENIYYKIGEFVRKPDFLPDHVGKGSRAAMTICKWVHAIYIYAKALRQLQPKVEMQKKVEKKLYDAQVTLGTKRVRCFQIKRELDSKIQTHKNASLTVKKFEKELKHLESKIARAERLMEQMKEYVVQWREEKGQALSRIDTSIGDSVLAAACVAYHGTLKKEQRDCSLECWISACKNGYIDIETGSFVIANNTGETKENSKEQVRVQSATTASESDMTWTDIDEDTTTTTSDALLSKGLLKLRESFSLVDILSTSSEQRAWHRSGIPRDNLMRCDALRIFAQSLFQSVSWSLIYDPDNQAETWLSTIHPRVKSDMENDKILCITPAPSGFSRLSMMSSSRDNSSLGIVEDSGGASSSMSDQTTTETTESATETEVTITVTATRTTRSEKVSSHRSGQSSKLGRVRFADEGSDMSATSSEMKSERMSEEVEVEEELSEEPKEENEDEEEEIQLEAEVLPHSLSELWVCTATDPGMPELLNLASIHGARLLIRQIEQNHLPAIARSLKGSAFHYEPYLHPNFCLYLSTDVQLSGAGGPGTCHVPWQHFAVTDLSLSPDALREKLESVVLGQERSEFEAQSRLMEADIFHLEEHMEELHDSFILRVADIEGPMLADTSLPLSIQSCKKDTMVSAASLVETRAMEVNLMNKKLHLSDVAEYGKTLYSHLVHVSKLQPFIYKITASQFIELYCKCLKSCVRGKGSSGSSGNSTNVVLKSRVVELNHRLTEEVLKCVDQNMIESDALVFKTLISLDHLMAKRQLSYDEMTSLTNANLIEKAVPIQNSHDDFDSLVKPLWIEKSNWNDLIILEQTKPVFSGVCRSISTKPSRWKEYLSSKPVLLVKVPYNRLHNLTTGQKALLWRTIRPDVFGHVVNDLNNTALGSLASVSHIFDLDNIYDDLSYKRPCVFFFPANERDSFFQPEHHIREKSHTMGIDYVEKSALFDSDIGDVLEDCMIKGRWLLLNNCHLASKWPNKFLQLLTILVNSKSTLEGEISNANLSLDNQEVVIRSVSTSTEQVSQSTEPTEPSISASTVEIQTRLGGLQCHDNFRLFVVANKAPDLQSILPGMIMQHSKFVAMEIPFYHRDLAEKLSKTVSSGIEKNDLPPKDLCSPEANAVKSAKSQLYETKNRLCLQLSLLQAILLERLFFGTSSFSKPCVWHDGDLVSAWRVIIQSETPEIAQKLCDAIMLGHIPDNMDLERAGEMVRQGLSLILEQIENKSLRSDVSGLIECGFISLLQKPDLRKLGLQNSADVEITKSASRQLSQNLEYISLIRSIENGNMLALNDNKLVVLNNELFSKQSLETLLFQLNETARPTLNNSILSPCMKEFYAAEVKRFDTVMQITRTDLSVALSVLKGKVEATEAVQKLLISILKNEIPEQWIKHRRSFFRYHLTQNLSSFVGRLHQRVLLLEKYMHVATCNLADAAVSPQTSALTSGNGTTSGPSPYTYNLAVFTRPDLFLQSVIFSVARSKFHDAHKYHFAKEFLTKHTVVSTCDSHNPFEVIYIGGLHLHRASFDEKLGLLQETRQEKGFKMPILKLTAQKKPQYLRSALARNPNENLDTEFSTYECPLWLNENDTPPMHCENDVITTVPLSTDRDCANWMTKGVSISCSLQDS